MTVTVAPVFSEAVSARLDVIEAGLRGAVETHDAFVSDAARHVIEAGGKRFRPLLVVLGSLVGREDQVEQPDARQRDAALVVELTHVASLYHDDVMDEAPTRRGKASANERFGNTVAILVGDFLFARASSIVAGLGTDYVRLQADTFARLVQGQIAETVGPGDADAVAHHLRVLADKTGSLIATSAVFGGMIGGLSDAELAALRDFGEHLGVAFQLADDVIDITSDDTGKTPGTDLREGIPTLPTLLLRAHPLPEDGRLLALLDSDLADDAALAEALQLLRAHPVIGEAKAEARRRSEQARACLASLPDGQAREALSALCDQVVERTA